MGCCGRAAAANADAAANGRYIRALPAAHEDFDARRSEMTFRRSRIEATEQINRDARPQFFVTTQSRIETSQRITPRPARRLPPYARRPYTPGTQFRPVTFSG